MLSSSANDTFLQHSTEKYVLCCLAICTAATSQCHTKVLACFRITTRSQIIIRLHGNNLSNTFHWKLLQNHNRRRTQYVECKSLQNLSIANSREAESIAVATEHCYIICCNALLEKGLSLLFHNIGNLRRYINDCLQFNVSVGPIEILQHIRTCTFDTQTKNIVP